MYRFTLLCSVMRESSFPGRNNFLRGSYFMGEVHVITVGDVER